MAVSGQRRDRISPGARAFLVATITGLAASGTAVAYRNSAAADTPDDDHLARATSTDIGGAGVGPLVVGAVQVDATRAGGPDPHQIMKKGVGDPPKLSNGFFDEDTDGLHIRVQSDQDPRVIFHVIVGAPDGEKYDPAKAEFRVFVQDMDEKLVGLGNYEVDLETWNPALADASVTDRYDKSQDEFYGVLTDSSVVRIPPGIGGAGAVRMTLYSDTDLDSGPHTATFDLGLFGNGSQSRFVGDTADAHAEKTLTAGEFVPQRDLGGN